MKSARPAAVAGMFYDADPEALRRTVAEFVDEAVGPENEPCAAPKAIIAPHAGYVYSGAVAGSAYATVKAQRGRIKRVVLLGPAHRVFVEGIAASSAAAFATPLGQVPLDQEIVRVLVEELEFMHYSDEAHAMEHSLEVHLPFLQGLLDDFVLLPFAVGAATPSQVDALLERLWGADETLIVISSDLSHYRSYEAAQDIDQFTSEQIRTLTGTALTGENACGYLPICGLLEAALRHRLRCEVLDIRSSGDTAGPRDRVVGYGAYAFYSA